MFFTRRPSGDPSKDICAPLMLLKKSFAKNLSDRSKTLNVNVREKFTKLVTMRRELNVKVAELEFMADKLREVRLIDIFYLYLFAHYRLIFIHESLVYFYNSLFL